MRELKINYSNLCQNKNFNFIPKNLLYFLEDFQKEIKRKNILEGFPQQIRLSDTSGFTTNDLLFVVVRLIWLANKS